MESSAKPDSLDIHTIRDLLQQFATAESIKTWWLAYSGGVDSRVLLHVLAPLSLDLRAVYIDHGLQPESARWAEHCRASCEALGVPFEVIAVDARPSQGEGPEAAARRARYRALAERVEDHHCLLTAQHRNDQAETFLLQLFRGGGARGLSGMPFTGRFSRGWHLRPLLAFSRDTIEQFAREQELSWVEDPTNQSRDYDRNYLRHEVLPLIRERWPAIDRTLVTAAQQQAENSDLLDQLAALDMHRLADRGPGLPIASLQQIDEARLRNLLRHWICDQRQPMPSRRVLDQIVRQMFSPRADASPRISWASTELQRYRDRLYISAVVDHDPRQKLAWDGRHPLQLRSLGQVLRLVPKASSGLTEKVLEEPLWVGFRQGGETIRPAGRKGHHALKQLFQEAAVPPWLRSRIPLIFQGEQLIAVAGYWIAHEVACAPGDSGLMPVITPAD